MTDYLPKQEDDEQEKDVALQNQVQEAAATGSNFRHSR